MQRPAERILFVEIRQREWYLSGTFSFSVKNPETGEIKMITDGRFDIKINIHD